MCRCNHSGAGFKVSGSAKIQASVDIYTYKTIGRERERESVCVFYVCIYVYIYVYTCNIM